MPGRGQAVLRGVVLSALALGPGGCERIEQYYSSKLSLDTPIDWWHRLQGGVIADERPPPPGADEPFPNMATVPARPAPTDVGMQRSLTARLVAERDRTAREAAQFPIATPQPGRAAPAVAATPPVAAPPPPMMARVDAADAPPPPPVPRATPPAVPPPPALQAAAAPTAPPRRPTDGSQFVAGPVPEVPPAPPAIPALSGIPAATTAPATPRPQPQVVAAFVPASAVLRPESEAALRALATRRGGGNVAVLGGGDARSADPEAQAAALPLAWRRARAMAAVLKEAGVPDAALRIDAAGLARDGTVRLLQ